MPARRPPKPSAPAGPGDSQAGAEITVAAARQLVRSWPIEVMRALQPEFADGILRFRETEAKRAIIAELASGLWVTAAAMGEQLHREIESFRRARWKGERQGAGPPDGRQKLIFRLLCLTNGRTPAGGSIRKMLSPAAVDKISRGTVHS
jgi:hypothetical protein